MAKLGNYYGLCPLIDHKSLLGVTEDKEIGHVMVTLGKNICIKYRISDQKQIHSWRTKDKFSSAVVYDFISSKYAAVFNNSYIRIWDDGEENIEKLRKYKFSKQIFSLVQCGRRVFVIFKNLTVEELNNAIEKRKSDAKECDDMEIVNVLHCNKNEEIYVGIIASNQENLLFEWSVFIDGNLHHKDRKTLNKRKNAELVGYTLSHIAMQGNVFLLTLWSDGYMFAYQLSTSTNEDDLSNDEVTPGKILAVLQLLSLKSPVSMISLNENYIALYGADRSEEGASLLLYTTKFKVTQSKVPFKLFTSGSKLWKVNNSLFLAIGQNLALIPYHLHEEKLSTLLGSHSNNSETDVAIVEKLQIVDCPIKKEKPSSNGILDQKIPKSIYKRINCLLEMGNRESDICSQVLQDIIEEQKLDELSDTIDFFNEIPEETIVKLFDFIIKLDAGSFKNDEQNETIEEKALQPVGRQSFLDKILSLCYSDVLLLPHLRRSLDLESVVLILTYIQHLLKDEFFCFPNIDSVKSDKKLIEWICIFLDAKYQSIILSPNSNTLKLLQKVNDTVNQHLKDLKTLDKVCPQLERVMLKKGSDNLQTSTLFYCIEKLKLF